jgi:hypothetical protein
MSENFPYEDDDSLLRDQLFYLLNEMELAVERGLEDLSRQDVMVFRARLDRISAKVRGLS